MSLACLQMKMSPAEALTCCTVNAACSLGLGVGQISTGWRADFCIWPFTDYREIAYYVASAASPQVVIAR
jgi:imidazolonepropionase